MIVSLGFSAIRLITVYVLLHFRMGVHAGTEDSGVMYVVAHYDGLVK